MKKLLFILMYLFASLGSIYAQGVEEPLPKDERYLEYLNAEQCFSTVVQTASVILYNEGAAVHLEFSSNPGSFLIRNKANTSESFATEANNSLNEGGTQFLQRGLPYDQAYEVLAQNSCEEWMVVGGFSTQTSKFENGINVSDALYSSISKFQRAGKEGSLDKFSDYLKADESVSFFDKVYFLQNYYNGREKIARYSPTNFPQNSPLEEETCLCEFVLNNSQTAAPAVLQSDGTIDNHTETTPSTPLGSNSYSATWSVRANRGASKYHQLWTEGLKAGGTEHTVTLNQEGIFDYTTEFARLRYNLFCQGYGEVPADCMCDIPIRYYYRYDTEVRADSRFYTQGTGAKNAVAAAEDVATVLYRRDGSDQVEIVAGGSARAESRCERNVNTEFWQNAVEVTFDLAQAIAELSGDDVDFQDLDLDDLQQGISDLIETPYYEVNECDIAETNEALALGSEIIDLSPNEPVDFYIFSNSNITSGGKRSWHSWGRVLSNFYLAAVVTANRDDGACCQEKQASWVFASNQGAPQTREDLRTQVGAEIGAWSPWNLPEDSNSGVVIIPTEYGETFYDNNTCAEPGGPTHPPQEPDVLAEDRGQNIKSTFDDRLESLRIIDLSGKVLYAEKQLTPPNDIQEFLRTLPMNLSVGVYLIEMVKEGLPNTTKVYFSGK